MNKLEIDKIDVNCANVGTITFKYGHYFNNKLDPSKHYLILNMNDLLNQLQHLIDVVFEQQKRIDHLEKECLFKNRMEKIINE